MRVCCRNRNYEAAREAIEFEEKGPAPPPDLTAPPSTDLQQQPLPPLPPPDSGHCSMDGAVPADAVVLTTPSTPGGSGGVTGSGTGSGFQVMTHQRTVRINGNEYAHIWETPLPEPKGPRGLKHVPAALQPTCRLEITRDPSGKNTFYTCTRYSPQMVHAGTGPPRSPVFDGYHHHMCPEASKAALARTTPCSAASHTPRGGTSTFCSPNTPTRTFATGTYGPSPHRHHHQPHGGAGVGSGGGGVGATTTAASFSTNAAGSSDGVTCGVVRHVAADFSNDGGPRYSTLERKPGYGNNSSSSSV